MKKIAICLHGDSSLWNETEKSFTNNIIKGLYPILPDVFIHTYENNNKKINFVLKDNFMNIFKPVVKIINNYQNFYDECKNEADLNIPNHSDYPLTIETIMTTKKIKLLFEEVKKYELNNNIKYDILMFATFNVNYLNLINIDNITDKNNIYIYTFTTDRDPSDKVVIGYSDSIQNIFIPRYENIFKVDSEFIHFKCSTNNPNQLLRYSYFKHTKIDWNWNILDRAFLLYNK